MIEEILIQNGLSKKEAAIYVNVLSGGEMPISKVASRSNLKRTTVYSLIDTLAEKGLISITKKNGVKYINALSPRILVDRFKKSATLAEQVLPELLQMSSSSDKKPKMRFLEGVNGIKQALREFSFSKYPSMGFMDYEKVPQEILEFIKREIVPERRKNNKRARILSPISEANRQIKQDDEKNFSEHRLTHFCLPENSIELLLFGTSEVVFLSFLKDETYAISIDSQAVYSTLQNIFLFMWNMG